MSKKTYKVASSMTITVYTLVEAETADDAVAEAFDRDVGQLAAYPFCSRADEAWVTDELDGAPDPEAEVWEVER